MSGAWCIVDADEKASADIFVMVIVPGKKFVQGAARSAQLFDSPARCFGMWRCSQERRELAGKSPGGPGHYQ